VNLSSFGRRWLTLPNALAARAALEGDEGTWTPVLTFATPGDVAVTYTTQAGTFTKKGREVTLAFNIVTAAFTFTTASGNLLITGAPFANSAAGARFGSLSWGGITKATYTQVNARVGLSTATINFQASGSGVAASPISATDTPTGGSMVLNGTIVFEV
jgi:hypothetical protein